MTQALHDHIPTKNKVERITALAARALTYIVYAYVVVVEVILFIGFILLLFGANPTSGFVQWAYRSLDRTMRPFRGIFDSVEVGIAGNDVPAVIDTSVIFAMIVYAILALALAQLLQWLSGRISRIEADNLRIEQRFEFDDAAARSRGYTDAAAEAAALQHAEAVRAAATAQLPNPPQAPQ